MSLLYREESDVVEKKWIASGSRTSNKWLDTHKIFDYIVNTLLANRPKYYWYNDRLLSHIADQIKYLHMRMTTIEQDFPHLYADMSDEQFNKTMDEELARKIKPVLDEAEYEFKATKEEVDLLRQELQCMAHDLLNDYKTHIFDTVVVGKHVYEVTS